MTTPKLQLKLDSMTSKIYSVKMLISIFRVITVFKFLCDCPQKRMCNVLHNYILIFWCKQKYNYLAK